MLAHRWTLIAPLALFAACAHPRIGTGPGGGGGETRAAPDESCLLSTGSVSARSPTITIGLSDAVAPRHAPFARNDAERIVFRHLYETPVRVDCDGQAVLSSPRSGKRLTAAVAGRSACGTARSSGTAHRSPPRTSCSATGAPDT